MLPPGLFSLVTIMDVPVVESGAKLGAAIASHTDAVRVSSREELATKP